MLANTLKSTSTISLIIFIISIFILINLGIPALLNFLNVSVNQVYTPFQLFATAIIILFILLPYEVYNPFQ